MPTIPIYSRPTNVRSSEGVRAPVSAAGHIGDALSNLGRTSEQLAEVAQRRTESESLTTAQAILGDTRLGVESDLDVLRKSGMPAQQFLGDAQKVYRKWTDLATERAKTVATPHAQDYLARKLNEFGTQSQIALGNEVDQRFRDEQRAGVVMQIPEMESRAIRARSPEEMQSAVTELREFLGSHTGFALKQEEATKMYLESVDHIREQRVRDAVLADPVGGLNLLASKEGAELKPEQVDRLTRFATAQITAQDARERREQAEEDKRVRLQQTVEETALTKDVLRGRDITQALIDSRLDGPKLRALVAFQKERREAADRVDEKSDPEQRLRWRIAAQTGKDPATGRRITWTDIASAPGVNANDKGTLVEHFIGRQEHQADRAEARQERIAGKIETLRNRRTSRGQDAIRLLLSGKDGLLAQLTGSTGDAMNDLNMYEALLEYDSAVQHQPNRDPVDIADEIGMRHARAVITRFAGDTGKLMHGLGVNSLDELLDKVESGQVPRSRSDQILRLGTFLRDKNRPTGEAPPEDPVVQQRSSFDAVKDFIGRLLNGPAAGRTPQK